MTPHVRAFRSILAQECVRQGVRLGRFLGDYGLDEILELTTLAWGAPLLVQDD